VVIQHVVTVGGVFLGVVESVGAGVSERKPGDRVVAIVMQGGYAEKVASLVEGTVPLPANISFEDAAALPVVYLTAWYALVLRSRLQKGETALIQAGASGVGMAGIQIAKLFGAQVIATAGGPEKVAFVREMGADHAIDYRRQDFLKEAQRITDGAGVNVVLESVGGETLVKSVEALAFGGRLVSVGNTVRQPAPLDASVLLEKAVSLFGLQMASDPFGLPPVLAEIVERVGKGELRPVVDRTFPLSQAAEAHRYVAQRKNRGKVLLIP
jgi:NADPH2:quinone reductase